MHIGVSKSLFSSFSSSTMHCAAIFVRNVFSIFYAHKLLFPPSPSPFPSFNWIHYSPPCSDSSWDPMCTCSMLHQEQAQTGKKKCAKVSRDVSSFDAPTHIELLDVSKLHVLTRQFAGLRVCY